jgi:hypothetical protein
MSMLNEPDHWKPDAQLEHDARTSSDALSASVQMLNSATLPMAPSDAQPPAADVPVTAEDMPIEVQGLLKSYALKEIVWAKPMSRHTVVLLILTRGGEAAERWLWSQCSREEMCDLLRRFQAAGADNEERAFLRAKLNLTEEDIPPRPTGFIRWRG